MARDVVDAPVDDLRRVRLAHARFDLAVARLGDDDVAAPSRLPGWTVGHVLTHVARNADSHLRRTEAACRGEVVDQYPGGAEGRAAEIDAGAARSAAELVTDVLETSAAVDEAWADVPEPAWGNVSRDLSGRERALAELPSRRWLEAEIHLVDVGLPGLPTTRDWPDEFVAHWLPRMRTTVDDRLPDGVPEPVAARALDPVDELAWLFGRLERPDLPALRPW